MHFLFSRRHYVDPVPPPLNPDLLQARERLNEREDRIRELLQHEYELDEFERRRQGDPHARPGD